MKIRITKKGLPKHQIKGQVDPIIPFVGQQTGPNYNWMTFGQQPPAIQQQGFQVSQGESLSDSALVNPVAIKRFSKNQWMPANQDKFSYGVNKGIQEFQNFLNQPGMKTATTAANGIMGAVDGILPFAQMWDTGKKNKAIERAYRETLLSQGPVDYTENRGDYEINTGMVDPYNTGAKSKGQFANPYYVPMFMQDGGITLGPISFSEDPIFRSVSEVPVSIMPLSPKNATSPSIERGVKASPTSSSFKEAIAARESGGNYRALPKDKNGKLVSSAAGKYQFLWNQHKDWISKVTGVTSKQEFLNNPEAQERAFDYWDQTVLTPNALRIKEQLGVLDSIDKIKAKIHFAGPGGAFKYYSTGQETKDAFGTMTSTYKEGGETNNPMKIRIVKAPTTEMEYGGQLGYGFDLGGRRVYTDMPESTQDTVANTMGPVPREMATIEAEKGETILTDVDGDGMKEHMTIGGKRHSEGGTPLAAEPGDFVFSDTRKMKIKSPKVLSLFNKSAKSGGYTPAQIAKQYDMNKYKAILQDPNADKISKRTAEMMLANYEKKLGMLSLVQEAQKGFPAGIPSVAESVMPQAKYGGYLEQYQSKGEVKQPRTIQTKDEFEKLISSGKYTQIPGTNNWEYRNKTVIPGTPEQKKVIPGTPGQQRTWRPVPKGWTKEQLAAHNARKRKDPAYTGTPDRTEIIPGTPDQVKEEYDVITFNEQPGTIQPPTEKQTSPGIPDVPEFQETGSNVPYGWTQQDKNNALLALTKRGRMQKFSSVRRDVNPVMPDFRNMDWRGRAAELQGTYNSQMDALGTYQSPTSLAANASFMAGQQAENLVNRAIDPIEQANVNVYNQVAGQRAGIMNQAIAGAAQNQFLRSQDRAVLNQQYINALNDADSGLTQAINQGITNASGIYNTNLVESPYYYYDPRTQKMQFNDANARAAFEAARRSAGPSDGDITARYLAIRNKLVGVPEDQKDDVTRELMGLGKGSGSRSSTVYPFNPKMNRTTVQQSTTAQQPVMPFTYNAFPFEQ